MPDSRSLTGSGFAGLSARSVLGHPTNVTATGTNQAGATQLASAFNNVTAASSQTGVLLPSGSASISPSTFGDTCVVGNVGSTTVVIYPAGSETSNNATSVSVAQYKVAIFHRMSATQWLHIITP